MCSSSRDVASALHLFLSNPLHYQVNLILFPLLSKAAHLFIVANATITQKLFPWTFLDKSYLHNCKIGFFWNSHHLPAGTLALPTSNIWAQTTLRTFKNFLTSFHFLISRKMKDPRDMAFQINSFSGCYELRRFGEDEKCKAKAHSLS